MVLQGVLVQHDEPLKEFKGEEMDANVGGAVHQASVLVPFLSRLLGDLRVLDHLVVAVHLAGDADSLGGEALPHHLVGALGLLAQAVAHEDRITHFDEHSVNTVELDELDSLLLHVSHHPLVSQGPVQPSVAVRGTREGALLSQDDLSLKCEAGKSALLEDEHILGIKAKVVVLLEEV